MRQHLTGACLLVLCGFALGCSTSRSAGLVEDAGPSATENAASNASGLPVGLSGLQGVDDFGTVSDPEALVASARRSGLSDDQVAAFADGSVSFAEYEALTRQTMQCLRDAGFDVVDNGLEEDHFSGFETLSYGWGGPESDTPEALELANYCEQHHSLPAEIIYKAEHGPTQEEKAQLINDAFITYGRCLEAAGISDLPDLDNYSPTMQDALLIYLDDPRHDCQGP